MAGFDEVDPANSCVLGGPPNMWAGRTHDRADLQPNQNGQLTLDQGAPVPAEYALQRRSGVASNMRVVTE
jgi:hypothetical protein